MPGLRNWLRRRLVPLRDRAIQRRIADRYRRIYRELDPDDLSWREIDMSEEALVGELQNRERRNPDLLLGFYSREGGRRALERYGFLQMLRDKGFDDLVLEVDTSEHPRHALRIYYGGRSDPSHLLVELVAQIRVLHLPEQRADYRMLSIEWLCMQDPTKELDHPPLPDQQYPGLGLFRWFAELLRLIATRLGCDGLMNHPAHFHNAVLYGKAMKHVDPRDEGRLRALERDLLDVPLHEATRAIDEDRVVDDEGHPIHWRGCPQVLPMNLHLQRHFHSFYYMRAYQRELHRTHYHLVEEGQSA